VDPDLHCCRSATAPGQPLKNFNTHGYTHKYLWTSFYLKIQYIYCIFYIANLQNTALLPLSSQQPAAIFTAIRHCRIAAAVSHRHCHRCRHGHCTHSCQSTPSAAAIAAASLLHFQPSVSVIAAALAVIVIVAVAAAIAAAHRQCHRRCCTLSHLCMF
jgi:hypothetical protein